MALDVCWLLYTSPLKCSSSKQTFFAQLVIVRRVIALLGSGTQLIWLSNVCSWACNLTSLSLLLFSRSPISTHEGLKQDTSGSNRPVDFPAPIWDRGRLTLRNPSQPRTCRGTQNPLSWPGWQSRTPCMHLDFLLFWMLGRQGLDSSLPLPCSHSFPTVASTLSCHPLGSGWEVISHP